MFVNVTLSIIDYQFTFVQLILSIKNLISIGKKDLLIFELLLNLFVEVFI